jgi:hypothetical protein
MDYVETSSIGLMVLGSLILAKNVFSFVILNHKKKRIQKIRQQSGQLNSRMRDEIKKLTPDEVNLIEKAKDALDKKLFYKAAEYFLQANQLRDAVDVFFKNQKLFEGIQLMLMFGSVERSGQIFEHANLPEHALSCYWLKNLNRKILLMPQSTRRIIGAQWLAASQEKNFQLLKDLTEKLKRYDWILIQEPNFFPIESLKGTYLKEVFSLDVIKQKWREQKIISSDQQAKFLSKIQEMKGHEEKILAYLVHPKDLKDWIEQLPIESKTTLEIILEDVGFQERLNKLMKKIFPQFDINLSSNQVAS